MRTTLVTIAVLLLAACTGNNHAYQDHVAYWRAAMSQGIPNGSSRENVKEWASGHNVNFEWLEQQQWLYANVERVPESGIPFPCSHWNIILKVKFDVTGYSLNNEVNAVGDCI